MTEIAARVIPVIILIIIGFVLRKNGIINDGGLSVLKNLIVNVFLPCSLFYAFIAAEINQGTALLVVAVILLCSILYLIGFILKKTGILGRIYSAEFFTGFEFGMVGIALFSGIFGSAALPAISVIGLGHEFFIWFLYLTFLKSHSAESKTGPADILLSFVKSPIIIAIISAAVLNIAGLSDRFFSSYYTGIIASVMERLSFVTMPLVLIVLGCSIRFSGIKLNSMLRYIVLRIIAVTAVSVLFYIILNRILNIESELFFYAWVTFFLLPPPYIIPIYIPGRHASENTFFSNSIMLYTILSLAAFIVFLFIFQPSF